MAVLNTMCICFLNHALVMCRALNEYMKQGKEVGELRTITFCPMEIHVRMGFLLKCVKHIVLLFHSKNT